MLIRQGAVGFIDWLDSGIIFPKTQFRNSLLLFATFGVF
jgi:hypothetical protein